MNNLYGKYLLILTSEFRDRRREDMAGWLGEGGLGKMCAKNVWGGGGGRENLKRMRSSANICQIKMAALRVTANHW